MNGGNISVRCGKGIDRRAGKRKGNCYGEMEAVTGMHRKSINRIIRGRLSRNKRRPERGREYGVEVDDQLIYKLISLPALENAHTVNVFHSMLKKKEAGHSVTFSFEPTKPFR
jgi:hypothetical protein